MDDASDIKRRTTRSFDDASEAYVDSEVHRQGQDLERIAEWCDGATRAVDVATGAGHTAGTLVRAGVSEVLALDGSPAMAETATTQYPAVDPVVGDAERLPLATDSADAVTCRIAAHHFPDPAAFVTEAARVLSPGGTLVVEDNVAPEDETLDAFVNRVERLRDPTHVRSHRTSEWHGWLRERNFRVVETVHLKKTLDFDDWVETQGLTGAERERVRAVLSNADPEPREFFEVSTAGGSVESFANLKALIKCSLGGG